MKMQTFHRQKSRIALPIAMLLVSIVTTSCSTSILNPGPVDCGFSAYYDTKDRDGKIEILFSRLTAEGNDPRNCGFNYIKSRVDRAEIDGSVMPERPEKDVYLYTAPAGFDMQRNIVTIQVGNKRYTSDPKSFQRIDTSFYVKLKRAN